MSMVNSDLLVNIEGSDNLWVCQILSDRPRHTNLMNT